MKSGQKSQPASLTAQNSDAINAMPYNTIPLLRLMKNQDRGNHHYHAAIRKYPLPPTVTSLKPNPPTARPTIAISRQEPLQDTGYPRGALPNAISFSLRSPLLSTTTCRKCTRWVINAVGIMINTLEFGVDKTLTNHLVTSSL